ncbi:MAG: hypothetical protein ABII82_16945 [Verrucomicrobiota bacterium]
MQVIDAILKGLQILQKFATPTSAFTATIFGLGGFLAGIGDRIDSIIQHADALAVDLTGTADFTPLALANYLLPLDQLIGYITAFLGVYASAATIRVIKSWIPTVSG